MPWVGRFAGWFIDEDNELGVEHNRPFEMLFDSHVNVNANALTWAADADKARTSTNIDVGKGSSLVRGVVSEVIPKQKTMWRLYRLDSAWIPGSPTLQASQPLAFDEGFDVVENPSRRSRTL